MGDDFPWLEAYAFFRTNSFAAKENFVLLTGGALLGLGITLIVETFIAWLSGFDRRFAGMKGGDVESANLDDHPSQDDVVEDEQAGSAGASASADEPNGKP